MRKIIFTLIIGLTFLSCDKYKAKRLSGIYACKVDVESFNMSSGYFDTTYFEDVEVKQDGESIVIFNKKIHIRDLKKGVYFEEGTMSSVYLKVRIYKNELFYFYHSGGLGGYGNVQYIGKKK